MNKIIFLDIDGTLVDVQNGLEEPSFYTRYAIEELIKNGDYVVIATGRYKGNVHSSIKSLNPSGYILSNGAYIEFNDKEMYENAFDNSILDRLEKYCLEHNGLFLSESQSFMYTPKIDNVVHDFLKKWKIDYVDLYDDKRGSNFYKCDVIFFDKESCYKFEKEFKDIVDFRLQTADKNGMAYDVNIPSVNKGSAVDIMIKKLNINKEDTYCFCDGINDLELIKACKNSYVMENGEDDLKKISYGIAPNVLEDGVYKKLVEIGLIKEHFLQ